MQPRGVLETALYARDLDAAERFFVDVLGLSVFSRDATRHVFFRCGRGMLLVFNPDVTATEQSIVNNRSIPLHGARGAGHMAFEISDDEIVAWRERLKKSGVAIESEVAWPGRGNSIYFRDPAGNSIELATAALWGLT